MSKGEVKTQVVNELKTLLAAEINAKLVNDQEARKKEREEDASEWNNQFSQIHAILKSLLQIQANSKNAEIESVNAALEPLNNISGAGNI